MNPRSSRKPFQSKGRSTGGRDFKRSGGGKRFGSSDRGGSSERSGGAKRFGSSDRGSSSERNGSNERYGSARRGSNERFGGSDRGGSNERYGNKERGGSSERYGNKERFGNSERRGRSERYGNKERFGNSERYGNKERYGSKDRGGSSERYGNKERYGNSDRYQRGGHSGSSERYGNKGRFGGKEGRGTSERYGSNGSERHELPPFSAKPEGAVVSQPSDGASRYVFGVNPALEALRARPEEIERVYFSEGALSPSVAGELMSRAQKAGLRVDRLPKEKLSFYAGGGVHQGVVLQMQTFRYAEFSELLENPGVVVVLDSLQDPQNVGAIIRSANAFGANGVVIAKDRAASITGAVVKASAGATEKTRIAQVTNISRALEELKEVGYWIAAADPDGEPLDKRPLKVPLAIVVGAEGPGVRPGVLSHCDSKLRIPISGDGVASLNASVAAGILLYEIARQANSA